MARAKAKAKPAKRKQATSQQTLLRLDYAETLIGGTLTAGQITRELSKKYGLSPSRGGQLYRLALARLVAASEPDRNDRRAVRVAQGARALQQTAAKGDWKAWEKIWHRLCLIDGVYEQPEQALTGILPVMVVPGMTADVQSWIVDARAADKKRDK